MSDSATPWTVARLCCHGILGDTRVGSHTLLQGIFLTQGSNPGLQHCRQILHCLSPQGISRVPSYSFPSERNQFSSVAQSYLTLCYPRNCSTPGLPVHHQLPGSTQTYVHQVGDAIEPSHPLSSTSPPAPNPSQYQGLFK